MVQARINATLIIVMCTTYWDRHQNFTPILVIYTNSKTTDEIERERDREGNRIMIQCS